MKTIVLDAGHGIETKGKKSFDLRLKEFEFNRNIIKRMKPILEKLGYRVVITCPSDKDVSLENRCKIANDAKADIFISIHANAFGNTWNGANGWEVLINKKGGRAELLAKAFEKESLALCLYNRGVKINENLYVLNGTDMPAVLVEHGFFTNKIEVIKLLGGVFRNKIAVANCKAIENYFKGVK